MTNSVKSPKKLIEVALPLDAINVACAKEKSIRHGQASVKVSVEISADFPEGVSDQIKRAVSENAASLGFKNKSWE